MPGADWCEINEGRDFFDWKNGKLAIAQHDMAWLADFERCLAAAILQNRPGGDSLPAPGLPRQTVSARPLVTTVAWLRAAYGENKSNFHLLS